MPIIPAQPQVEPKDTLSLRLDRVLHDRLKQVLRVHSESEGLRDRASAPAAIPQGSRVRGVVRVGDERNGTGRQVRTTQRHGR